MLHSTETSLSLYTTNYTAYKTENWGSKVFIAVLQTGCKVLPLLKVPKVNSLKAVPISTVRNKWFRNQLGQEILCWLCLWQTDMKRKYFLKHDYNFRAYNLMVSLITAHNTSLFTLAHLVISFPVAAVLLLMLVLLVTFGLQILSLQQIRHYQSVLFCQ